MFLLLGQLRGTTRQVWAKSDGPEAAEVWRRPWADTQDRPPWNAVQSMKEHFPLPFLSKFLLLWCVQTPNPGWHEATGMHCNKPGFYMKGKASGGTKLWTIQFVTVRGWQGKLWMKTCGTRGEPLNLDGFPYFSFLVGIECRLNFLLTAKCWAACEQLLRAHTSELQEIWAGNGKSAEQQSIFAIPRANPLSTLIFISKEEDSRVLWLMLSKLNFPRILLYFFSPFFSFLFFFPEAD